MAAESRRKPYIWVTHLTKLLAGEVDCVYAAWFRAHYKYDKRDDGRTFDFAKWNKDHGDLMAVRRKALEADGWTCRVENANKFTLEGRTIDVGGKMDLLATKDEWVKIVDGKTGKARNSDFWQVVFYIYAAPLVWPELKDRTFVGEACYSPTSSLAVSMTDLTDAAKRHIFTTLKTLASGLGPVAVPSPAECSRCDVGNCTYRSTAPEASAETFDF